MSYFTRSTRFLFIAVTIAFVCGCAANTPQERQVQPVNASAQSQVQSEAESEADYSLATVWSHYYGLVADKASTAGSALKRGLSRMRSGNSGSDESADTVDNDSREAVASDETSDETYEEAYLHASTQHHKAFIEAFKRQVKRDAEKRKQLDEAKAEALAWGLASDQPSEPSEITAGTIPRGCEHQEVAFWDSIDGLNCSVAE